MSISKLNFEIGSANSQLHQRFTVDTEGTRERERYHWKDLDATFSDHLFDRQIDVRSESYGHFFLAKNKAVEMQREFRPVSVGVGAVCVYDHPGDEATLVKQMVSDRTLPEYHIDLISERSGVALLEPSRSIRRFLRDVWTSDAALVGGGSETSGLATQIVWGVGAETFAFDAALEGGGVLFVHVRAKLP
ncbi:hypothetical protein F2Q69_00035537 [Brassica cretica]|uniref:Uncharacterized protein n=1 Tax=Brassica cretica TaxID=69181 RepID=A0A8S9SP53_BRACR|nr:hypothetical protein F2Q69_00035537 [Brassica cretica]